MYYWQIERLCGDCWIRTDFRISADSREAGQDRCDDIARQAGWTARLGRRVAFDDHYCDFAWVNMS